MGDLRDASIVSGDVRLDNAVLVQNAIAGDTY
jgi:hypothetical protein